VTLDARGRDRAGDRQLADQHQQIYLRRLRNRQLSLSLLALCVCAGVVAGVPLVILLVPAVNRIRILGFPLSLLMVVIPAFPLYVVVGRAYERRANALDHALSRLVDEDDL
jgi:putative solute:sodium symporter small subunit